MDDYCSDLRDNGGLHSFLSCGPKTKVRASLVPTW